MDLERVVRGIAARLDGLDEAALARVQDAVREILVQERRWTQASFTVESERERRREAEALRAGLEGIVHQTHFADASQEILRQAGRIVLSDSSSLALLEPSGEFRIVAAQGFPEGSAPIGARYRDGLSDLIRESHRAVAVADARNDERYARTADHSSVRSWMGIPLTVESELIGMLALDRRNVSPFDDDEVRRVKALAFSAAAALRNARLLDSVERYATVMEHLLGLYKHVMSGGDAAGIGGEVVEGALRLGYPAGLLARDGRIAAASGGLFDACVGRAAPGALASDRTVRVAGEAAAEIGRELGVELSGTLLLVPLADDVPLGTLALLDSGRESAASDAAIEAYAARAATALACAGRR